MINTLLINENPDNQQSLKAQIEEICPEVSVYHTISQRSNLQLELEENTPDLVLLEVNQISNELFYKIQQFVELGIDFVILSQNREVAYEAIRFSASGFILKPLNPLEIQQCIKRISRKRKKIQRQEQYQNLIHELYDKFTAHDSLGIPTIHGIDIVRPSDIIRCEGLQRCTVVYLKEGKKIFSSYNIGQFINLLSQFNFYAVHKSHLVNISEVKHISKEGYLLTNDGENIPIARRRRSAFLEKIPRP